MFCDLFYRRHSHAFDASDTLSFGLALPARSLYLLAKQIQVPRHCMFCYHWFGCVHR